MRSPLIISVRAVEVRATGMGTEKIKTDVFFCVLVDEPPKKIREIANRRGGETYSAVDREETFFY